MTCLVVGNNVNIFCFLFLEMREAFEEFCKDRGGMTQMCDSNGNVRCKCAFGYVYDREHNLCLPTF